MHRVIDRPTNDLDFFTPEEGAIGRLVPRLEAALVDPGLHVIRERSLDAFVRLSVSDGVPSTVVDLARDYRMFPPVVTEVWPRGGRGGTRCRQAPRPGWSGRAP